MVVQLYMKEKSPYLANQRIVKTPSNRDLFVVEGSWGRRNDKIFLYTMAGHCLVEVKQVTLSVYPKFKAKMNGHTVAIIKKRPRLLAQPVYTVSKLGWKASGNYLKRSYKVKRKFKTIMTVEKAVTTFGEFCSLEITNPEDAPLCCVLAVLIDHYAQGKSQGKKRAKKPDQILQEQI